MTCPKYNEFPANSITPPPDKKKARTWRAAFSSLRLLMPFTGIPAGRQNSREERVGGVFIVSYWGSLFHLSCFIGSPRKDAN